MKIKDIPEISLNKKSQAFKLSGYTALCGSVAVSIILLIKLFVVYINGIITINDGIDFAIGVGAIGMLIGAAGCCFAFCLAVNSELRLREVMGQLNSGKSMEDNK